jgi:hypothetical protein
MLTEVLVLLSYDGSINNGCIKVSGKQYCWIEKSDYLRLRESEPTVTLGFHKDHDIRIKLNVEEIENQKLIDTVLELGPDPFSTFRAYFKSLDGWGGKRDDQLKISFKGGLKYRSYPTWHEFPEPEREISPLPDIVNKIMRI